MRKHNELKMRISSNAYRASYQASLKDEAFFIREMETLLESKFDFKDAELFISGPRGSYVWDFTFAVTSKRKHQMVFVFDETSVLKSVRASFPISRLAARIKNNFFMRDPSIQHWLFKDLEFLLGSIDGYS